MRSQPDIVGCRSASAPVPRCREPVSLFARVQYRCGTMQNVNKGETGNECPGRVARRGRSPRTSLHLRETPSRPEWQRTADCERIKCESWPTSLTPRHGILDPTTQRVPDQWLRGAQYCEVTRSLSHVSVQALLRLPKERDRPSLRSLADIDKVLGGSRTPASI